MQQGASPVNDIIGDMKSAVRPITSIPSKIGKFIKEKAIDQKISHRSVKPAENVDYRNFVHNQEEQPVAPIVANDKINVAGNKRDWIASAVDSMSTAKEVATPPVAASSIAAAAPSTVADSVSFTSGSKNISLGSGIAPEVNRSGVVATPPGGAQVDAAVLPPEIKQPTIAAPNLGGDKPVTPGDALRQHVEGSGDGAQSNASSPENVMERRDSVAGAQNLEPTQEAQIKEGHSENVMERRDSVAGAQNLRPAQEAQIKEDQAKKEPEKSSTPEGLANVNAEGENPASSENKTPKDVVERMQSPKLQGGEPE